MELELTKLGITLNCRQYFFAGLTSKTRVCAINLLLCSATVMSNETPQKNTAAIPDRYVKLWAWEKVKDEKI